VRRVVVLLLLAAALLHPVAHAGTEALACAWAHGADVGTTPVLPVAPAIEVEHGTDVLVAFTAGAAIDVPARAPPAA
jgi:hypothetical protein